MIEKLTKQHISLLFSLYITQFLGLAFFTEALIAILRKNGIPLENLGLVYMLGLFWVFRFLWAPFIDKIEIKRLGHYKGWIIIFQSIMVIILLFTSSFNLISNMQTVIILSVFFSFFSASQDIAVDALVFKSVPTTQRQTANALKAAGGMIGMVLGGGVGLIIYSSYGWKCTILVLAFSTAISLVQILFYKEPKRKKENIQHKIDYKQYIDFWKGAKKRKWLLLLFVYPITISSAYALITPILVDANWELGKIGFTVNIVGYGIGVVASFGASWLITNYGKKNILIVSAVGQIIGIMLLLLLLDNYNSSFLAMFIVGFIFSFYTPSSVVMTTLMMDQSSSKSPASQFAIQHSVYMFSGILFSSLAVSLSGVFGYSTIIIASSIIGLFAIYFSTKLETIITNDIDVDIEVDDENEIAVQANVNY